VVTKRVFIDLGASYPTSTVSIYNIEMLVVRFGVINKTKCTKKNNPY